MSDSSGSQNMVIKMRLLRSGKVVRAYQIRSDTVTIGSEKGCSIRAAGASVAPKHATIFSEDGELTLVPEPGAEVFVNGESVDFAALGPDDITKIGPLTFKVELAEARESIPPTARPKRASSPPEAETPAVSSSTASASKPRRASLPSPIAAPSPIATPATVEVEEKSVPVVEKKASVSTPVQHEEKISLVANDYFWDDSADEEEDEVNFIEPFDLADLLIAHKDEETKVAREPYCATHIVRLLDGRVCEAFGVLPRRSFVSRTGEVRCRILGGKVALKVASHVAGTIYRGSEEIDLASLSQKRGRREAVLLDGNSALIQGQEGTYKMEVYRPPRVERAGGFRINPSFFSAIGIAAAIHLVAGIAVAAVTMMLEVDVSDLDASDEVFAEVTMDKPETLQDEVKVEEAPKPKDTLTLSEKAPAVSRKAISRIREKASDTTTSSSVSSLLSVLSKGSGKEGASDNLKDLVSNVDAVAPGSGLAGGFNIAGAIASLPGGDVNIAKKGGGGYISTLSGDQVAGKDSKITHLEKSKSKKKKPAKVTKMSSGAKVKGSLSKAEVSRVVNANAHHFQACYEKALMNNPNLAGRVVFDWTISPTGKVTGARVRSSTLGSSKATNCMIGKLKRWKFPKPSGGDVPVTFPFLFRNVSS